RKKSYNTGMIYTLRGTVTDTGGRFAVVETGGIGYKISVTDDTLATLKTGSEAVFWTYDAVREDSHELYGFPTRKERDFFELLLTISGIGPKSALNIMTLVSIEALTRSVRTGSVAHLVKVSGIGRKTAEKIVLELKDKLGAMDDASFTAGMSSDMDAIEALKALGYGAEEAREALKKIDKDLDVGAKVKAALKALG
ncbi:MAG: Holliday junction branch migration protein RuvA, partial [Patescibacteria group bacterium]|nr:Holliday junction branch migration protein RuvA [Patescibacteria group bacterium]